MPDSAENLTPRRLADTYVGDVADLNPITAVQLGLHLDRDDLPDMSPTGLEAAADLSRRTLARLDAVEAAEPDPAPAEARCARLLRERLTAGLALHDAGEDLRAVRSLASPVHSLRDVLLQMPAATDENWAVIAGRLGRFGEGLDGYRATLTLGLDRGLLSGPRQVATVLDQLETWLGPDAGSSWFAGLAARGPESVRPRLEAAAASATAALADFRNWLRDTYAPAAGGTPDAVGRDRYRTWARLWNGADFDLDEAYAWAWDEFHKVEAEMRAEADRLISGATPVEATDYLKTKGPAVEGAEQAREHLQRMMDRTISDLQGSHFDLPEPIRRVEAMIAPAGSAPAPYYTPPSLDFTRPGRTWLPATEDDRYPLWFITSAWYHEGVPGHHLQLAQWLYVADDLSKYQATLGMISSNVEGWALYAERLMDELGYHSTPATRLGYLAAQMLRLQRVIVDIGMHLGLDFPADSPYQPGRPVTPEATREFLGQYSGLDAAFLDGEVVRYLGVPGQAIGYKLGERAWLRGRAAAQKAHGATFDLKAWHMAALAQGSQGLDDLYETLAAL
jgi:uncharacterized protein (DUF885 family)